MAKLHEIEASMLELFSRIDDYTDEETGEISAGFQKQMDFLALDAKVKIENIGIICQTLKNDADLMAAEITRLKARKISFEGRRRWLLDYVTHTMETLGIEKHKGPRALFTTYLQKNPDTIHVERPAALPIIFQRITVEPAKEDIKKALEKGQIEEEIIGLAGIEIITGQKKVRYK